jgi:hypothetical protein
MNWPEPLLTPQLARRVEELRACHNVSELHIVGLYDCGARALVRVVPRPCGDDSCDAPWLRPSEPFLMMIGPEAMASDHAALH